MIELPTSEPFTFDPALHLCRDERGLWVPSVTQILEAQGLSPDWDVIRQIIGRDRLDRKTRLGTEVHYLTDVYDEFGDVDPAWMNDQNIGFFRSWIGFREMAGFIPVHNSWRFVATVNGMKFTGEIDNFGLMHGKYPAILDKKCSEMNPPAWGYQTGGYECGWARSPRCGRVIRGAVRLKEDGSPGRLLEHTDHGNDAQQFMSALTNATERIKHGLLKEPEE